MSKLFNKATWLNLWRGMLASKLWHRAMLCLGVLLAALIVFAFVYYRLLPRYSYRKLTNSIISDGSVVSASAKRGGESYELNDIQILDVVCWLADYRSENRGIEHASEWEGSTLELVTTEGRTITLFIEPSGVVFDGVMGKYRLKVDYNELFYLINSLSHN